MDVILSALPPSLQVQSVPVSASATQAQPQLPPELASLPKGATLEGFVINRDAQNNPILRTERGDVLIKSELFLKTGSEVVVRLTSLSGQTNARIVSVDGQPIQSAAQPQQMTTSSIFTTQQSPAQSIANAVTPPQPSPTGLVQAALLAPTNFGNAAQTQQTIANILRIPPAQLPPLNQGAAMQFRIAGDVTLPSQTTATTGTLSPNANNSTPNPSMLYSAYGKLPSNHVTPSTNIPSESGAPSAKTPTPSPATTLTARVIGHEGAESIVRTSIGTVKLYTAQLIPTNTTLTLEFIGIQSASTSSATQTTISAPLQQQLMVAAQFAQDWDSLADSFQLLRQDNPSIAQEVAARLPNTKSGIVNQVLFFVSALRGNDFQRWLGSSASDKLEEKAPGLLQRLSGEFTAMRVMASEAPEQPWQMLLFPLMHEDELHQARLYVHHDEGNDSDAGDEARFIVEIILSELGELQIDGLIHSRSRPKQFDLVIRSLQPLESEHQQALRQLYQKGSEISGFIGNLRFLSGAEHWVEPLEEMKAAVNSSDGSVFA